MISHVRQQIRKVYGQVDEKNYNDVVQHVMVLVASHPQSSGMTGAAMVELVVEILASRDFPRVRVESSVYHMINLYKYGVPSSLAAFMTWKG